MEVKSSRHLLNNISHKEWRKEAKKFRRKRIRQLKAEERDRKEVQDESIRLKNPSYLTWLAEQRVLELFEEEQENIQRQKEENEWLLREEQSCLLFTERQRKLEEIENAKEVERFRMRKEFEAAKKRAQILKDQKMQEVEDNRLRHEELIIKIENYINGSGKIPTELNNYAETNPSKDKCQFFSKTGTCRFGDRCSKNHARPGISKTILIPNFFAPIHLLAEKKTEYGNDLNLEFDEEEVMVSYNEFFIDVCTEFESLGLLKYFFVCSNFQAHLRGNVYVEYVNQRDALKAYRFMQGRYYAGKRINVEFCSINSWPAAICGLAIAKKCPKGSNCHFMHLFRNPGNKYPYSYAECKKESVREARQSAERHRNFENHWDDEVVVAEKHNKHWRWSESPDIEIRPSVSKIKSTRDNNSGHHSRSRSSRRDKQKTRSRSRSSESTCRNSRKYSLSRNKKRSHDRKSPKRKGSEYREDADNREKKYRDKNNDSAKRSRKR